MNFFEAKHILKQNGYNIIKEGTGYTPRHDEPDLDPQVYNTAGVAKILSDKKARRKFDKSFNALNRTYNIHNKYIEKHRQSILNAQKYLENEYNLSSEIDTLSDTYSELTLCKCHMEGLKIKYNNKYFFIPFIYTDTETDELSEFRYLSKSDLELLCAPHKHDPYYSYYIGNIDKIANEIISSIGNINY